MNNTPHWLLGTRNVAAILDWSYSCCVAAEDTRCQSTVQYILAQISRLSQKGLGETQFGINNHHSDLLSLVVSVFNKLRLHHIDL